MKAKQAEKEAGRKLAIKKHYGPLPPSELLQERRDSAATTSPLPGYGPWEVPVPSAWSREHLEKVVLTIPALPCWIERGLHDQGKRAGQYQSHRRPLPQGDL
jgi:hypothetical protein